MFRALKKLFSGKTPAGVESEQEAGEARDPGLNPGFVTDPNQILKVLLDLENDRSLFTVTLPQVRENFSSALLEVNAAGGYVVLDELVPELGHKRLQETKKLRVNAVLRGISVSFDLEEIETGRSQGIAYYKAPLPLRVYYPQRRDNRRISIGQDVPMSFLAFYGDVRIPVRGQVCDLSRGGIGVVLNNNRARIRRGGTLRNCRLGLPENEEIAFDLQLRFVKPEPRANHRMHIGGYFENLTPENQRKLQRFLAAMEREELRRERN